MTASGEVILTANNVRGYYVTPQGYVRAVDGCDLLLYDGEILGLAGESGCGKSTFSKLLMGFVKPPLKLVEGSVRIAGVDIYKLSPRRRRREVWGKLIAMVPQYSMNALNPTRKIADFIYDVMREKLSRRITREKALELARKRFEELGLPAHTLEMYPFELSGGMRQRAVIAISTLLNPKVLIADEPTSALDVSTQHRLLKLLNSLVRQRIVRSMIFVSHDIATLRQICDRLCIMYAGKIVELGETDRMIEEPLHPYTQGLIDSVVTVDPTIRKRVLKGIPGAPPNLLNPPPGCRFWPRCPYATERCKREEPPLVEVDQRRLVACWRYVSEEPGG